MANANPKANTDTQKTMMTDTDWVKLTAFGATLSQDVLDALLDLGEQVVGPMDPDANFPRRLFILQELL